VEYRKIKQSATTTREKRGKIINHMKYRLLRMNIKESDDGQQRKKRKRVKQSEVENEKGKQKKGQRNKRKEKHSSLYNIEIKGIPKYKRQMRKRKKY
ncbi:hypothetical protein C922_05770, partial [Plasmodium inui San Antonio 1]